MQTLGKILSQKIIFLSAFLVAGLTSCSKVPDPKVFSPTPTPVMPTFTPAPTQFYDTSNLGAKHPKLIYVPEIEACKTQGIAFIRGKFSGTDVNRCSNVKVESGWCDFSGITAKFAALGNVTLANPGAGIPTPVTPAAFFSKLQTDGWLPDQCATVAAGNSSREPVVFLYREPKDNTGLGVMPVCLPFGPDAGAGLTFKNQALCEI